MAGNFIGTVFATLKDAGVDTKNLDTGKAVDMFNEMVNKGKDPKGFGEGTPAEQQRLKETRVVDEKDVAEKQARVDALTPPKPMKDTWVDRVRDKMIPDYVGANERYNQAMAKREEDYNQAKKDLAEAKKGVIQRVEENTVEMNNQRQAAMERNEGTPAEQQRLKEKGIETPEQYADKYASSKIREARAEQEQNKYNLAENDNEEVKANLIHDLELTDDHYISFDRKHNVAYIYDNNTDTTRAFDLSKREYKPGKIKGQV